MTYTPAADPLLTPFARQLRRDLTPADRLLWSKLRGGRQQGLKFRRQDPIGPFIADFVCEATKLVVEVNMRIIVTMMNGGHAGLRAKDIGLCDSGMVK